MLGGKTNQNDKRWDSIELPDIVPVPVVVGVVLIVGWSVDGVEDEEDDGSIVGGDGDDVEEGEDEDVDVEEEDEVDDDDEDDVDCPPPGVVCKPSSIHKSFHSCVIERYTLTGGARSIRYSNDERPNNISRSTGYY